MNTGTKFESWYVDNLKHMIDKFSNLKYDKFEVITKVVYGGCMINFKCLIYSKTDKIYILI